ncbi:MAG: N-acetylmuramic acid 6-phosphate etherase [Tannerellaceae bacterium]|jgi:N-acetylmuramic acid 6-phosphate etherase|nr:N-acetylmuramic acid 6-phosphate etherase [Tannerellaceae bacterium]
MNNITESPSPFRNLEQMSLHDILEGINREDARVHEAVGRALPQIESLVEHICERALLGGRLFYLGAGTSGRLGVLDASEIPPTFGLSGIVVGLIAGGDRALRHAVEAAEDDAEAAWRDLEAFDPNETDTVIGIAASGTTPYVVGGVVQAGAKGLLTGGIACNPGSPLAQAAQFPIELLTGPEFVTGSTRLKAGTAQKMTLNMISTSLMIKMGRVKDNRMVNMQISNRKLFNRGARMIADELLLPSDRAAELLLQYGSVRAAVEAVRAGR